MRLSSCLKNTSITSLSFGTTILAGGLVLLFTKTIFVEYIKTTSLVLTPNSLFKKLWVTSPFPLISDVYLFNWTNPNDLYDIDIKPSFEELGPYRFVLNMEKINLTWNDNNTVSYKRLKTLHYDDKISNDNLTKQTTTINILAMIIAEAVEDSNVIMKESISFLINNLSVKNYISGTIKEVLYEGIDHVLISLGRMFPFAWSHVPRFEKVGVVSMVNNTIEFDGVFNQATGIDGNFDIQNWNYNTKIPYFKKSCGQIQGTLGEIYKQNVTKDYITIFVPELCRYVKLDYLTEVTVKGILGYKYIAGDSVLDNGTIIPENKCFCDKECIPSGMVSLVSCHFNLPIFASLPHFYQADPLYLNAVKGLKPDVQKHETYIVVEPVTGLPIAVSIAFQINALLRPLAAAEIFEDVRTLFFPIFWVKVSSTVPEKYALALRTYLYLPWILAGVSIGLMLLGLYILLIKNWYGTTKNSEEWYGQTCRNSKQFEEMHLIIK